jgi:hypothetical protein
MSAKTAAKPKKKPDDIILFCARCFATGEGGSWGGFVDVSKDGKDNHCYNCGAGGCAVKIPRWAVKSICEQASWVGKRYYPSDEDYEHVREVKALRDLVKVYPGRSAEKIVSERHDDADQWWVHQELPGDKRVSVIVKAATANRALEKARLSLPYIPQKELDKKCKKKP